MTRKQSKQAVLIALFLSGGLRVVEAAPKESVDTGIVDLNVLAQTVARLDYAKLVRWRGTGGTIQDSPAQMTFQYLSGSGLSLPTRSNPADSSANNQNDLWSNNALEVKFQKPNDVGSAIVVYTDNKNEGGADPIAPVGLRGGLVGGAGCNLACVQPGNSCSSAELTTCAGRASVVPLFWKTVPKSELIAASNAIGANSPLFMPTEIESASKANPVTCTPEGPYSFALKRESAGFCDASVHYFMDKNNLDPNNLWYTDPSVIDANGAFNYASFVGPFGVNASEAGLGGGFGESVVTPAPPGQVAYAALGAKLTNAIRTTYRTIIYVEQIIR